MLTPKKFTANIVHCSPKPLIKKSNISPFELTIEQEKELATITEHKQSNLLSDKIFLVDKKIKNYAKIIELIKSKGGLIVEDEYSDVDKAYFIGTKENSIYQRTYHSDVIFALCDKEIDLEKYILPYYLPASRFSEWNENTFQELSISVNYLPLLKGDVWLSSNYDENEVSLFAQEIVDSFNSLCNTNSYTRNNEAQNRRFVHLLFDLLIRKWNHQKSNTMR